MPWTVNAALTFVWHADVTLASLNLADMFVQAYATVVMLSVTFGMLADTYPALRFEC